MNRGDLVGYVTAGASTGGGEVDVKLRPVWLRGGENSTPKGGRISPDIWVIRLIIDDCIMPLNAFPGL